MNTSGIIRPVGHQDTFRSVNAASRLVNDLWNTISGPFRYVCSMTTDDVVLPDNQGYSVTPLTDLKERNVKGTSLCPLLLPVTDDHAREFNEVVRRIKIDQQSLIMEKANATTPQQLEQIVQCCLNPEQITTEHLSFLQSDAFAYAVFA